MLTACPEALEWLRVETDLGMSPRTIDAYGRALADYLGVCRREDLDPLTANRSVVARYVRDLLRRPNPRGANVVAIGSGVGLANATLQQRLVALRLFYDYLIEEGRRDSNPVGRGRFTAGKAFGGKGQRGLLPRFTKLPWIPTDEQWQAVLEVARAKSARNRVMLALAYDAGLRREELCLLRADDLDPAHRTVRVRAETTKTRAGRVVPYSATTGVLLRAYLIHRHRISRARGPLFLSESPAKSRPTDHALDLVQGGAIDRCAGAGTRVQHPHLAAPVPDGPGALGLGPAHHRPVCGSPQPGDDAAVHPSLGT